MESESKIVFDRRTLSVLRYINRRGERGARWGAIEKRFGEDTANPYLLANLSEELFTVTKNENGNWVNFDPWNMVSKHSYVSFCTPKGKKLLQDRSFDFWKWVIPTLISVLALAISAITFLLTIFGSGIVRVELL